MSKKTYLFSFQRGLPVVDSCLQSAWNREPLTCALKKCNISFTLPSTIPENSIVALLDDIPLVTQNLLAGCAKAPGLRLSERGVVSRQYNPPLRQLNRKELSRKPANQILSHERYKVIGQCSLNRAIDYWTHLERINLDGQNFSTRILAAIHQKAVRAERQYLDRIEASQDKASHNAGLAVLPEYWGHRLGLQMMTRQIELCKELKHTTLFCETTNRYSAAIVEELGFTQIAKYLYKTLATELKCSDLAGLDDSFTVWCLNF